VPELRDIADRLGRLAASERAARGVERGGRQAVVGVTIGGELADVLPCELALLADPDSEDLFYARLTERRLLSFELTGDAGGATVRARRPGAVIACVDTSGSMRGGPEAVAKAALLAVARRVLGQGRRMTVLLFGGRGAMTELDLSPSRLDLGALFALLMTSYYGGTDFDGPVERALTLRETGSGMRDADLLLVTDGLCQLGRAARSRLDVARARDDLEVVTVVVGGYTERVAAFSDLVWPLSEETLQASGLAAYG
ncbi:MAG: VWA domain-containing protein, partial [Deltaproteobacteria bacterium]